MKRDEISGIFPVRGGLKIAARDGREAVLRFDDFERLRNATDEERKDFRISVGGLRWDSVDEDVSFDSVFSPDSFPLRLSRFSPLLNMSEIARRLGIAQPLMAAYVSGAKRPSAKRRAAILAEIASVGRELAAEGAR